MKVIAFFGRKNSGKTYLITRLIQLLRDKRVIAIKHIHDEDFEIDYEGKDTWNYAQNGAMTVVAVSKRKFFIVSNNNEQVHPLSIVKALRCLNLNYDYVFIEGFHKLLGQESKIYKVIIAKSRDDLNELMKIINKTQLIAVFLNGVRKEDVTDIIYYNNYYNSGIILNLDAEGITKFKDLIRRNLSDNF